MAMTLAAAISALAANDLAQGDPPPTTSSTQRLATVPGHSARSGPGRLYRYVVQVERSLDINREAFADEVQRTLFDRRGWGGTGRVAFQRVRRRAATQVILASPATTDRLCAPIRTNGIYSCSIGSRVVLNHRRWTQGASSYGRDLTGYRRMLVNHEMGHRLGHGHRYCPGRGRLAPVMLQQTKGLQGCRRNPWPLPSERGS